MRNVTCYRCKMVFGLSDDFYATAKQMAEKMTWYCPAGHGQVFTSGETEADILRRERDRLKQNLAERKDEYKGERQRRLDAERSASARKGQITRLKNRAAAGVCPCCSRSFENLRRHMAGKHPGYRAEEIA